MRRLAPTDAPPTMVELLLARLPLACDERRGVVVVVTDSCDDGRDLTGLDCDDRRDLMVLACDDDCVVERRPLVCEVSGDVDASSPSDVPLASRLLKHMTT